MSPQPAASGGRYRRRQHYIDRMLQKRLLIALILLEMLLLCGAGVLLYASLDAIVEENLYRVHFADQPSMFQVLFSEALPIIGGLVAANIVTLFVADRVWAGHVLKIMLNLRSLLLRTKMLDLYADPDVSHKHHVLDRALAWRSAERARHQALRALAERAQGLASSGDAALDEYRQCLQGMRRQLPPTRE